LELAGRALDAGADVYYQEEEALYQSLFHKKIAIARLLLSRRADATAGSGKFLAAVAYKEELELLQNHLEKPGVDANAHSGRALGAVVGRNWLPGAKFLLAHRADRNIGDG